MNPLSPPAIVREEYAETFRGLIARVKQRNIEIAGASRNNLTRAIANGLDLLKIREMCDDGTFSAILEEMGYTRSAAYDHMDIASCPALDIANAKSIREAAEIVKNKRTLAQAVEGQGQKTFKNLCARCTRIGKPSCEPCRKANPEQSELFDARDNGAPAEPSKIGQLKPPRKKKDVQTEPGELADETPEPEDVKIEKVKKLIDKITNEIQWASNLKRPAISVGFVSKLADTLQECLKGYTTIVRCKGPKEHPPSRKGKCNRCEADVLWVTTLAGKNWALDLEPCRGGNVELIKNVPTIIKYDPSQDGGMAYRSHHFVCKAGRK